MCTYIDKTHYEIIYWVTMQLVVLFFASPEDLFTRISEKIGHSCIDYDPLFQYMSYWKKSS